jgi:DNA modification methylase
VIHPKKNNPKRSVHPQGFLNGEVHDWYRIVLGFSDHLVATLLDELGVKQGDRVIDPFCGSGTTLVEAMKRGVEAVGIDANPASCFAAAVKTNWNISSRVLLHRLEKVKKQYAREMLRTDYEADAFYSYLEEAGFLDRKWISRKPVRKIVALKRAVVGLRGPRVYKNALMLALMAETVHGSANVRFGPELYCGPARRDAPVLSGFETRVRKMVADLRLVSGLELPPSRVICGDSRACGKYLRRHGYFSAVICSPPYPTEHDYTRNARLELAMLGAVSDRQSLRRIKTRMIRSHTKGIYRADNDSRHVKSHDEIGALARKLDRKAKTKDHGFARLYSTVLREYFGGMKRHFASVKRLIAPGGRCAYIVGDQSSYLRVHIPTAKILADLAKESGFTVVGIRRWRRRWSTTRRHFLAEHILILRVPKKRR